MRREPDVNTMSQAPILAARPNEDCRLLFFPKLTGITSLLLLPFFSGIWIVHQRMTEILKEELNASSKKYEVLNFGRRGAETSTRCPSAWRGLGSMPAGDPDYAALA